ncbi:pitrilysin family protein [uncultured Ferrovibrio sp.]|jgi:predicted Zn-dependent peptidase|uniref:M16 family metallopeptidase n=1 Tax=uncultured Ferrovibrio sp. TaxID=1576913 RepID=UPI00262C8791|nr:pitrilysin family protein [uncultured Ferrovibrio sp.]
MTVRISKISNGMRVVSETMPQVKTVAVGVWVDAGARDETPEINGVAHMLEHMAFKGTERRSALAIAEEIEAVGGHLNAFTSREQTAYYARVMEGDIDLALDILADILQHSVFDPAELERERGVIIQEIGQSEDTPDDIIFDHLQETAFPEQALGRSILGTVERVSNMKREDLQGFLDRFYHAPNLVLVAAGAVDHDKLVAAAETLFSGLSKTPRQPPQKAIYRGGEKRAMRDLEQAHIAIALPGVPFGDPMYFAMQVYATVLGGGMSSRLFQEVREKRGLAYSVYAYPSFYRDGGLMTVYAGTSGEQLRELMPVLADELAKLTGHIEAAEIDRARAQLKVGYVMSLESSGARLEQLGRHMLIYNRPLDVDEVLNALDAVDEAAVKAVAERVMRSAAPTVAALGPIGALEDYARFSARFG